MWNRFANYRYQYGSSRSHGKRMRRDTTAALPERLEPEWRAFFHHKQVKSALIICQLTSFLPRGGLRKCYGKPYFGTFDIPWSAPHPN